MSTNVHALKSSSSDVFDQVGKSLKKGRRQANVLIDQGGEFIDTVSTRATDIASDLSRSVVRYTKKNPRTALLLALGAGVLLLSAVRAVQPRD
jgi:hypothetical protein